MRIEVQEFIRDCEHLAGLNHQNELTHEEREVIINFGKELVNELAPSPPLLDRGDPAPGDDVLHPSTERLI